MEDKDHNDYLLFKKEQADQDHNVNKLDALFLIHPQIRVEEVVATSEAEKDASPDKPKGPRIKHTATKNIHYVRRSTRQRS